MANRNDPLGYDMYYRTDMDPGGRSSSGHELVGSAIVHRLTTDLIPLIDSENGYIEYGEDVRRWLGAGFTQAQIEARAAGLGPVLERDQRIQEATVTATTATAPGGLAAMQLSIVSVLRTGETLSETLSVSELTVQILAQGK